MPPHDELFDLPELADRAGVSARTVRYYIQQGLLPSPESRGPGTRYGREHLDRLVLIRRLQREHLPLAEIRRRLDALDEEEIQRLAEGEPAGTTRSSASEYIRRVMAEGPGGPSRKRSAPDEAAEPPSAPWSALLGTARRALSAPPPPPVVRSTEQDPLSPVSRSPSPARSQWDRYTLAPDIELHVRRPLTREQNRQIERLMEAARQIFSEEEVP